MHKLIGRKPGEVGEGRTWPAVSAHSVKAHVSAEQRPQLRKQNKSKQDNRKKVGQKLVHPFLGPPKCSLVLAWFLLCLLLGALSCSSSRYIVVSGQSVRW